MHRLHSSGWNECCQIEILNESLNFFQMERFEARKVLEILHTKPITSFCAPPTMYKSMVQVPDDNLFNFHSIRFCIGGGEAVNAEVAKVWKQKTGRYCKKA